MGNSTTPILVIAVIVADAAGLAVGFSINTSSDNNTDLNANNQENTVEDIKKITVAVMPNEDPSVFDLQSQMLEEYFTEKLGIETEVFFPIDATTTVESIVTGDTQIAFMSARPAEFAYERSNEQTLLFMAEVRPFTSASGEKLDTFYWSEFWVKKDSGIEILEDAIGKNVAFSGPTSTSGYLFPMSKLVGKELIESGDGADTYFDNVLFSGGYQQSLNALMEGQVDIAAGGDHAKYRFLTPEEQSQIKVIERQGPVPTHGITYRADIISPEIITKFEKAVLDMKSERPDLLEKALFGATDFTPVNHHAHLAALESALESTQIPPI